MARKTREVETANEPEFTPEQLSKIVSHNVKRGLLHLPDDFGKESEDSNSDSVEEIDV